MKRKPIGFTLRSASGLVITATALLAPVMVVPVAGAAENPPALVITNDPLPEGLQSKVYNKPSPAPVVNPADVMEQILLR